jgi:hypothetical protein
MISPLRPFCSLLLALAAILLLGGCATDPETRQLLRQIKSVAITKNVDVSGSEASLGGAVEPTEELLVDEFVSEIDHARVFPQRVAITNGSLQTWNEEVGEMSYDAQFKLHLRDTPTQWRVEALLQSRYGVIVWRSSKSLPKVAGTPGRALLKQSCLSLVQDLKRARR